MSDPKIASETDTGKDIGPEPRGGFTPLANAEIKLLLNELEFHQLKLYIGLRTEARGKAGSFTYRDRNGALTVYLAAGEALITVRGLARRYGMTRRSVQRALCRFEALGLVSTHPALVETGPRPAPRPVSRPGPRPTVVRFLGDREIVWERSRTRATSRATFGPRARATSQPGQGADGQPGEGNGQLAKGCSELEKRQLAAVGSHNPSASPAPTVGDRPEPSTDNGNEGGA